MNKRTKRWLSAIALGAGTLGAAGALLMKKNRSSASRARKQPADVWARPGMSVVFRAELKPSRSASERTFRVAELLPSGRVRLEDVAGEHTESEFEPLRRSSKAGSDA